MRLIVRATNYLGGGWSGPLTVGGGALTIKCPDSVCAKPTWSVRHTGIVAQIAGMDHVPMHEPCLWVYVHRRVAVYIRGCGLAEWRLLRGTEGECY